MFYAPHGGGVRRYLGAKHDWLERHTDIRHTLLTPGDACGWAAEHRYTLKAFPLPFSDGYRFPLRIRPWLDALHMLHPNLIEAGDPYRLGWAAVTAGQTLGAPVIAFYHSDFPRLVSARFGQGAEHFAQQYVRRLYSRFDLVLTPSKVMQAQLQALGVARTRVQPLGVDLELFHPRLRSPELRRTLGLSGKTRLLVFAGRNAREKHIGPLMDAAGLLGKDYHLLLVGPDMPRAAHPNVSVFSRYIEAKELAVWLASSDALVHAGDMETFGLIALEAMACGIPLVGVDAGAMPELVSPLTAVLATKATPAALAEAIAALFQRDTRKMGWWARKWVETRWGWERSFRDLHAVYLEMLGLPSLPVPTEPCLATA
ncbi:MAG: glycosyltransferase [Betaproteobacteria bacterium]|nr:glycosyltransferase [Betaproteobacteria bacterium]